MTTANSLTLTVPMPSPRTITLLAAASVVALAGWGLENHSNAHAAQAAAAHDAAISDVTTITPQAAPAFDEITLPGEVRGDNDATINARTDGYIIRWFTDIGAHVRKGQILAEIASPELDEQVRQAEAELHTAEANAGLARSTARRVAGLVPSQSVSVQDSEDRAAAATGANAQVAAALANLARLRQLKGFERVTAPFDGTITARSIDVGSLISAGGAQGTPLFHIADTRRLRTYVDVPQTYAAGLRPGLAADLAFPDRPGKPVTANVSRTAAAIDPASRTLKTEIDIDNREAALFPGAFVEVHFHLPPLGNAPRVPANALLMRPEGPRLAIVDGRSQVHLRPITLGRDFGTSVEVLTGLHPQDKVIVNPAAATDDGDYVRPHAAAPARKGA
ncbi:MAG: efflux RND transporter periplasmic adaptor subunit [Sphingomonadales bacterium]|nr:efflux RND transporter periplasmic adaptor subunit [Sphingomonadales bacterium]MDE2171119.1 efflux RND transporter periplasmic adaptor subunit [Sphingomonadales bacterium]